MGLESGVTVPRITCRAILAVGAIALLLALAPHHAGAANSYEIELWNATNASRAQNARPALAWDEGAAAIARAWSSTMAAQGSLSHNPNLSAQVSASVTNAWTRLGENVAYANSAAQAHSAFMSSSGHRGNILGDFNRVGIGVVRRADGVLFVTEVFIKGPSIGNTVPTPDAPASGPALYLRNALSSGVADQTFGYGAPGDVVVTCDWNRDGVDTPGVFRSGTFYLRNGTGPGIADVVFPYGVPGDVPICGDWNGDGYDTIGVFRRGVFYLRNTNGAGVADRVVSFGVPTDQPTVGDWNGDGTDTVGIYRVGVFYLRNDHNGGFAQIVAAYGMPGDRPTVGDWNNDGYDTLGIFRGGALYLRNSLTTGIADYHFGYGVPSDRPIIGDWNGDGVDSLGVVR
jgi:uncharacterized protein YkwD